MASAYLDRPIETLEQTKARMIVNLADPNMSTRSRCFYERRVAILEIEIELRRSGPSVSRWVVW